MNSDKVEPIYVSNHSTKLKFSKSNDMSITLIYTNLYLSEKEIINECVSGLFFPKFYNFMMMNFSSLYYFLFRNVYLNV